MLYVVNSIRIKRFVSYIYGIPLELNNIMQSVRMAEWSKTPDSSSGSRKRAWVQIPLLTPTENEGYESPNF